MIKRLAIAATALTLLLGTGCSRSSNDSVDGALSADAPAPIRIQPADYARVFDQIRDQLRDLGFILDRVDAQLGVITTMPKGTGGIMTPWDQEQSGLDDRLEDAVERHRRIVRIEFSPVGVPAGSPDIIDLRTEKRPIEAQVSVSLYRFHAPGWRLNTQGILESTRTHDPALDERGMGDYGVAIRQDDALARRIADRIKVLAEAPPVAK
jgi:hypothetical protein